MVRRWLVVAAGLFAVAELIDGIIYRLPPGTTPGHRGLKVIGCLWFDVGWSWPPAYSLSPS